MQNPASESYIRPDTSFFARAVDDAFIYGGRHPFGEMNFYEVDSTVGLGTSGATLPRQMMSILRASILLKLSLMLTESRSHRDSNLEKEPECEPKVERCQYRRRGGERSIFRKWCRIHEQWLSESYFVS